MRLNLYLVLVIIMVMSNMAHAANKDDDSDYNYSYHNGVKCRQIYDPYEKFNRKIFVFNSGLDYVILRPIAIAYKNITNDYTKTRVSSFLDNIQEPLTSVNYAIQMNFQGFIKSVWRFLINTTFGVGGMFDVASKTDLPSNPQSFGSTLAHYGVGPGPYLVIPFFGNASIRDAGDMVLFNSAMNPLRYSFHKDFQLGLTGAKIVSSRAAILPFTDSIAKSSPDPYIAVRSAVFQYQEAKMQYPANFVCPVVSDK